MGVKHYLSRTYLKGFSFDGNQLFCYDKVFKCFITQYSINASQVNLPKREKYKIKPGTISSLGCKSDNFWSQEIESCMSSDIENSFPKLLDKIKQKLPFLGSEYDQLIQFILLQQLRSQVSQKSFDSRVIDDRNSLIKENKDEIDFFEKNYSPRIARDRILIERLSGLLKKNGFAYSKIRNMTMEVFTGGDYRYISGDFPFTHEANNKVDPNIYFPLTENIMIKFSDSFSDGNIHYVANPTSIDINRNLYDVCERYVFCSNPILISSLF